MKSMMLTTRPILRPASVGATLAMALDARAPGGADDGRMHGPRGQHHAVAGLQIQASALALEHERDRAVDAVEDLLEAVAVRRVAVVRAVRPRVAAARLGTQPCHQLVEGGHQPILRLLR